jgi:hypothetical protein
MPKERTMTTTDSNSAIDNAAAHMRVTAASLDTAVDTRTAAETELAAAVGYQEAGRNAKAKLKVLHAEDALEAATLRVTECERVHAAARMQWETLMRRAFVDREVSATRAMLAQVRALMADCATRLADRQATAQLLGVCDSGGHPHAAARAFVEALERYLHQLDPPPPAPNPPPPRGQVRVRALVYFSDAVERWRHDPDTVFCLPEAEARWVIERGWATEVEA